MTLLLLLLLQAKSPDLPLQGPAAKCGTEIPWQTDRNKALALSKKSGKPVLWWVTSIPRSPMDRKRVLHKYMLSGPWMMPDIVFLASNHFIPLRAASDGSQGIERFSFIEPGFVLLDSGGKVVGKMDRISTFQEDHLRNFLLSFLKKKVEIPTEKPAALKDLAQNNISAALGSLKKGTSPHERYLLGAALHLGRRDDEGRTIWKTLVRENPSSRWAWKASAELAGDGPFVHGFEVFTSPRKTMKKVTVEPALTYLLSMQRSHGGWDDSWYNFGGDDSLPNVYMASTALISLALLEWKEKNPHIEEALVAAEKYMRDESNVAHEDKDEILWAYIYRLLYFSKQRDEEMMEKLIATLSRMQLPSGAFRHEYANPFVTASTLHALYEAKSAGATVSSSLVNRALQSLKACRTKNDLFSYYMGGGRTRVEGAAGRLPLCEMGFTLWKGGTKKALRKALAISFQHHDRLERVRKYDDHADRYQNGGFFFWYDLHAQAEAIRFLKEKGAAKKMIERVLSIAEIDGAWVDSHELGRPYGTAMALLVLKRCSEVK